MPKVLLSSLALLAVLLIGVTLSLGPSVDGALAQGQGTPLPTEEAAVEATEDAASQGSQLLWMRLDTGFSPVEVSDVTAGGGVDMYSILGDPCVQNTFASPLPVFELHLLSDSPHIRIGFTTDDGTEIGLALWDANGETWWCTTSAGASAELGFEPLVAGDYPVYVGVLGETRKVTGTLYITEAREAPTPEATPEATQAPSGNRRRR